MSDTEKSHHLQLWEKVCVTDPKHVKPITGKDYGGNSPKPYWIIQRLTEEFGPCGLGWGYTIASERFERFSDTDTLHVAMVRLWYVLDGKRGEVEQMGQTKATYMTSKGTFKVDEDAPKKSVTDALVKCASYLGFAGDIFSGRWDDSKYVAWAREQYAEDEKPDNVIPASFRSSATMGALEGLEPTEREYVESLADRVNELAKAERWHDCIELVEGEELIDTHAMALWAILDSKTRSAYKKAKQQKRERQAA